MCFCWRDLFTFHENYDHQSWQSGNLGWWDHTYQFTWSFDHMVIRHMKNFISARKFLYTNE